MYIYTHIYIYTDNERLVGEELRHSGQESLSFLLILFSVS